jgi:regulator of protease activity HflC (stomatin/prohibitin superfamily)
MQLKKAVLVLSLLLVASMFLGGCGYAAPDAGTESVLVKKPYFFGHGGVADEPVKAGRTVVALTTEEIPVNMQPQQFPVHFDDLMSSDGVPLDFDAVVRLQVTDSVRLIRDFGTEWYQKNVEAEFRNRVRQSVRKHGMNETAINTSAIEAIDNEVSESMEKYIVDAKLPVHLIQITVGKANPPDSIKSQRIETAAQEQRVNTEKQRKLAEDQRKAAELSRAEADNAYRTAMQLSPEQYLALETIKMQHEACSKGNCTFIVGGGSKVTPVLDVKK